MLLAAGSGGSRQPAPTYEVYAVRYATIPGFPVRGLIAGADSSRRIDIAMAVWLLRGADRTVLVDAGFYRDKFVQRWKPRSEERRVGKESRSRGAREDERYRIDRNQDESAGACARRGAE